jgi:tetratricopeptide (TPR) repeat protein
MSIGRQYVSQDEYAKGRRLLEQAHDLSRSLAERSTRARTLCALAQALSRGDDLPRGESLYQEGMAELPDEPIFILDRIFCLERGSEVAQNRGDVREGVARAEAAQRLVKRSPLRSDVLELGNLVTLAGAYGHAGRQREAIAAFEQAAARLTDLGRDDTQRAATLFNNWGVALTLAGRPLDAEQVFHRAVAIGQDNRGENVSPMLLVNYARSLRDLGRLDEAADYAERGYEKARQAGDTMATGQVLLLRASIYRGKGDLQRSEKMLAEVNSRLRTLPPGHIARGALASQQALNAQALGHSPEALDFANKAVTIAEAAPKVRGSYYLRTFLVYRSDIELALGRADQAAADGTRALALSQADSQAQPESAAETFSSYLGQAYLSGARAAGPRQSRPGPRRLSLRCAKPREHPGRRQRRSPPRPPAREHGLPTYNN